MYGAGYGVGLIVAVAFGLFLEHLRRRHNQNRIQLKKNQISARLQNKINQKRQAFRAHREQGKKQ